MTRYTFGTFKINKDNREACRLCQDVANLKPVKPLPLLLIGESGAGKTHLLCSVVNHIRKHVPGTALAYVTAKDFPEPVRALVEDPGPVTRARSAVLLVDQLEKFPPERLRLLGRIAPLFLEENRSIVLAAQTNPEDMPDLPDPLKKIVKFGRVVRLAKMSIAARNEGQGSQDTGDKQNNETLQHELENLNEELDRLAQVELEKNRLEDLLVQAQAESQRLKQEKETLEQNIAGNNVLGQEVRSLQRALEETRKQRDSLQNDAANLAAANAEIARLRKQLAAPSSAHDHAPAAAERIQALEKELQDARMAAQDTQAELNRWALKVQAILQQIELNRARLAESNEKQCQRVLELRQHVENLAAENAAEDETEYIGQKLSGITETAEKDSAPDQERLQKLYAQLHQAAEAIQNLSDKIDDAAPAHPNHKPGDAEPFPTKPTEREPDTES